MTEQEVRRYLRQMKEESSERAFKGFYDLTYDRLFRIAYYYLKHEEWAQEVVLDVFLTLWKQRDTLAAVQNIEDYCFILTRNASLNSDRKRRFRPFARGVPHQRRAICSLRQGAGPPARTLPRGLHPHPRREAELCPSGRRTGHQCQDRRCPAAKSRLPPAGYAEINPVLLHQSQPVKPVTLQGNTSYHRRKHSFPYTGNARFLHGEQPFPTLGNRRFQYWERPSSATTCLKLPVFMARTTIGTLHKNATHRKKIVSCVGSFPLSAVLMVKGTP